VSDPFAFGDFSGPFEVQDPGWFGNEDGGVYNTDFDELFRSLGCVQSAAEGTVDELSVFPATPFSIDDGGGFGTFSMDGIPW